MLFKHRLQNLKVDGTHLRGQNGVALQLHLGSIFLPLELYGLGGRVNGLFPAHLHGGNQAADTDANSTQVIDLVDFEEGVELVAALQNLGYLIRGNGIQATAKGIELQQLQVVPVPHKSGCSVQPGMVNPLVHNAQLLLFPDIG